MPGEVVFEHGWHWRDFHLRGGGAAELRHHGRSVREEDLADPVWFDAMSDRWIYARAVRNHQKQLREFVKWLKLLESFQMRMILLH